MIGAYLWAKRGHVGSPYQYLFALYIGLILLIAFDPVYVALYVLWLGAGEGPGWKPKLWRNNNNEFGKYGKLRCVLRGLYLGGLGALLVPLATIVSDYLHRRIKWWKYEWNEGTFGAMAEILALLVVGVSLWH